ncbi:GNAT family N-acetyltransferase [Hydrogenophaga sp. ZJX-1]|uniref:GNAT family N-acetyltransferase n=1 Tax=Hydrogenophaga sp. ZJX-1 TaxID=3404778 RepID=UPI003B27E600
MSILLRALEDSAIPALFELLQNDELYRYLTFPAPKSPDELVLRFDVDVRPEGQIFTVHRAEHSELPIGFCRYRLDESSRFDIGYAIGYDFWGRGYATSVVAALLNELTGRFKGGEVVATVNIGNIASIRALEKNGFLFGRFIETILHLEATCDLEYSFNIL